MANILKMKKMTCKEYFSSIKGGVRQFLVNISSVFGYNSKDWLALCAWRLLCLSFSIIMAFVVVVLCIGGYEYFVDEYPYRNSSFETDGEYLSRDIIYFEDSRASQGYLLDKRTGTKVLKHIDWISMPLGSDTLVAYSNGKACGYFNAKDGRVVISPRYQHAGLFSEGLAAVEEGGKIKFVDGTGQVVIEGFNAQLAMFDDYVFHGGMVVVPSADQSKYGLMNTSGKMILPAEYDHIDVGEDYNNWSLKKDGKYAVVDADLNFVLQELPCRSVQLDETITVTMDDHSIRKYDYEGKLIDDFFVNAVKPLLYQTDKMYYTEDADSKVFSEPLIIEKFQYAYAHLFAYEAGQYEGLMTKKGHIVTKPLYKNIEAIGPDTYLCTYDNDDKVVVNGKGKIVK